MTKKGRDDEAAWAPRSHGILTDHVRGAGSPGPVRQSGHAAGAPAAGTEGGPELERLHYPGYFGEERASHGHGAVYGEGPRGWQAPGTLPEGYVPSSRPPLDDASRGHAGETPSAFRALSDEGTTPASGSEGSARDESLRNVVSERLAAELDSRGLTVTVRGGSVVLTGWVADRATKHRAVALASAVDGVETVADHLRVEDPHGDIPRPEWID
jgi:hypothetical protein